jgi:hypothetical protein
LSNAPLPASPRLPFRYYDSLDASPPGKKVIFTNRLSACLCTMCERMGGREPFRGKSEADQSTLFREEKASALSRSHSRGNEDVSPMVSGSHVETRDDRAHRDAAGSEAPIRAWRGTGAPEGRCSIEPAAHHEPCVSTDCFSWPRPWCQPEKVWI